MINKGFLLFLRAGITGIVDTSNAGVSRFKIQDSSSESDIDFAKVEELAVKQNVLPLVYDGYKLYYEKCGLEAPVEIKLGWYGAAQQAERHYNEHLKAIRTMTDYLAEKGFRTMVLKGYSLSLCYPKPSHRPCGDIDIYCFGDYQKVDELVSQNALCKVDKSRHHHTVFHWNGIMVENHYDFINIHDFSNGNKAEVYFKELATLENEKIENVYIPNPTLHALFLIRHAGGHFASTYITMRHLLDWYLFCKQYGDKVDWSVIDECDKRFGIGEFHRCLDVCAKRLMEDDMETQYDVLSERMWQDILNPKFTIEEPKGAGRYLYMWKRWWGNRWKHGMVYNESQLKQLVYLLYSHALNPAKLLN